jgi:sporulation protein YlmC with PRC-barrel domain
MQLSKLLGLRVVDAGSHPVGTVVDVRLTVDGDLAHDPPTPRVLGLVISPRTGSSYLGYERSGANAPLMLAALARWRHRGTFLAAWEDVARIGSKRVTLRPGFDRFSAVLRVDDAIEQPGSG